ncbi:nucleotide-binding universal stress UspA family protein [Motilibacter peucedani]|uniref:Nucleotide-binding universal stress UspA family protein n=1 Tax=Motilibacter peucedani TaxID=598650 RepID=A0A420XRP6_9ACTN|nr:universal stress protein [Motilibacter peucedani]RKS77576.1 nucleotide-binding universal stress UspA family protein [Motilibacter peucedani]
MTIVVGYVPKPEGRAALRRAAEDAQSRRERLVVVSSVRDASADGLADYERELSAVGAALQQAGIDYEVRQLVRGQDASEDLIAIAEEVQADVIVIGLRRRTPVGKLILGSNAQRILLDAPCPVLAVKAGEDDR